MTTTTTTNMVTADDFLAGVELAEQIKYPWERTLLEALTAGTVCATYPSGFVTLNGRLLASWQVARFVAYGIMKYTVTYDDSNPQSMFDAPVTSSTYELTELGSVVARLVSAQ